MYWSIPLVVESPDRLFWVSTSEFIYNQSGGSPVGAWWFLTSGQADVQRAWIKHMAHLTTERRLFWVSNEIWGMISIHKLKKKKKIPFVRWLRCCMKYGCRSCSPTWVAKQGSIAFMTIKAETGSSKCVEWEGKWMDVSSPAWNIQTEILCDHWHQVFINRWNAMRAGQR